MGLKQKLKEAFEPVAKFGAFYTGGNVEWHGDYLYCQNETHISKVCIETGISVQEIAEESEDVELDPVLTFTTNSKQTITAHKSGLLKAWNSDAQLEKQWKSIHKDPIASLHYKDDLLLSGGSDGIVRAWDVHHQMCVSVLKGCTGVINVLTHNASQIYASGDDGRIIAWEDNAVHQTYEGHLSKVTAIQFTRDKKHFVSSGRDEVIILWQVGKAHALRTMPVDQAIEGLLILPSNLTLPCEAPINPSSTIVACAGEKGCISIWDIQLSKELYKQKNSVISASTVEGSLAVTYLLADETYDKLALVSSDHNIIIHHRKSFAILKQLVGFTDEILDVSFCGKDEYLAVATNSNDIKLYHNASMNCELLKGHTGIVMALAVSPADTHILASCANDNTVRLWLVGQQSRCLAVGTRHTATVSTLCFFNAGQALVSGSHDTCVKLWQLNSVAPATITKPIDLLASRTEVAHAKDINGLAVSPNDKLIASCSQDKTVKLWSETLDLLGVLKGHKRSVWCCRFSPVDQVLISSSADCTIKLWSISELNCLKTLAGHDASILRVEFLSEGMQILSAGGDGLVKLFDIKTSECRLSLEEHDARIWSLSVAADESSFVTGGADSLLVRWRDVTAERRLEEAQVAEQAALDEQRLANCLQQGKLLKALRLSLKLNRPSTVLRIVQGVIKRGQTLAETVGALKDHEKEVLLQCANEWNTNSRNCQPAQLVLNILLMEIQSGTFRPSTLVRDIEGNLGYTQRHFNRVSELLQDLHFIDYTVKCMQPIKMEPEF